MDQVLLAANMCVHIEMNAIAVVCSACSLHYHH